MNSPDTAAVLIADAHEAPFTLAAEIPRDMSRERKARRTDTLRIGIIGAFGKMGAIRHRLFSQMHNCDVVEVCDTVKRRGYEAHFTDSPHDVITNPDIDAVCICTPNHLTCDLTIQALDNGKHVFAEKPPGTCLADVMRIKDARNRNPGLQVKFGFNHRYHEAVMEAKRLIDTGNYGDILWVRGRYGKSVDKSFSDEWRAKRDYAGGGILLDQGIHMLDLFLHFCGGFQEVKSFCSRSYWKMDIEDNVFAIFRNAAGQTASLHSTMTQWRHLFALEIFLEHGYMVINGILSSSGSYTHNGGEELTVALNRSPAPAARHTQERKRIYTEDLSFRREIEEFLSCIRARREPTHGTVDDAERLMTLVEKIYTDDTATSA